MKKIIIIDYGCGNIVSLQRAIKKIGFESTLSNKQEKISDASHLILPGVGAFGNAMKLLKKFKLDQAIIKHASKNKPLLGICLGMQLLLSKSYEFGEHKGLDLIKGNVEKLTSQTKNQIKIPHIGWSAINFNKLNKNYKNFDKKTFYFVHSYIANTADPNDTIAFSKISNIKIPAVINHKNITGFQFHPEKSRETGLKLINLFCNQK
jgi:glutamine amidotransferase